MLGTSVVPICLTVGAWNPKVTTSKSKSLSVEVSKLSKASLLNAAETSKATLDAVQDVL